MPKLEQHTAIVILKMVDLAQQVKTYSVQDLVGEFIDFYNQGWEDCAKEINNNRGPG